MEALHSSLTTGEQSGGQEHCQPESPLQGLQPKSPSQQQQQQQPQTGSSKPPHGAPQQPKQSKRQLPERKRLRVQRQSIDSDTNPEHKQKETKTAFSPEPLPSTTHGSNPSKPDNQEGTPKQKRERKPQKPGKYVCTYCGRACAKPSVLQKHIRSHTGERPYPCAPCGFSFKTKSNLYKHRKSHTHRVKAGLTLVEPRPLEEQITESEDEARHLSSASTIPSIKNLESDQPKDGTAGSDDSYAVRKRLAMRLSRGKHTPRDSAEDKALSLILGSKESTESGYFSRSESTEQSQDSYPNTSAKSYAEIILGKYGRLGHLQRMSRHNNQQSSIQEDKSVPFTVPKKQVIDHITKLITINEAVVDTSKIDSVKPRRFSLSRKNCSESQKSSSLKEPLLQIPKPGDLSYKSSGSITMGVPCEKFQHHSLNVEPTGQTSSAPLLRSHSMPSTASSSDVPTGGSSKFRLSQSFDERQPSESQVPRRYGMLRRQPAIEIPLGAEITKDEAEGSHSFFTDCITTVPDHKQSQPQPYECEACGTGCKDWEGYKKHKQTLCLAHCHRNEVVISQMECSQITTHAARPGALALRKRRKAESFELDDPLLLSPSISMEQSKVESNISYEGPRRPTIQTCSVIQHTSSFEKQESVSENQSTESTRKSPPHKDYQHMPQKQPEQSSNLISRKLVRQHNVQVPEILVTEESNVSSENLTEPSSTSAKQSEKSDEFQWPQRSSTLAQLPIEKLPPKKKRLRLAEAAQSSGESSFESISLPHSPSQDSSASYASSRSTSFEESNRPDTELTSSPLRRSRAPHMLTVPGVHQHREMRRSASEQAPHDPQPNVVLAEIRSKSFDYSSLSPERSAIGWRERRKCLLMKHTAVRDPDEEEEQPVTSSHTSEKMCSSPPKGSVYSSKSPSSPLRGEAVSHYSLKSQSKVMFPQWKPQNVQLTHSTELLLTDEPLKEEALNIPTDQLPLQTPHPTSTKGLSGAARAHYLAVSTGLKLEIPSGHSQSSSSSRSYIQHSSSVPHIMSSLELLQPVTSTAVAVRLQADTLTPACAIYTTFSQSTSPKPLEAVDAVSHSIDVSTTECGNYRSLSPDLQAWSVDDLRSSGSGSNKRMLSPSNSIELSPESQQQQKRVKEEEVVLVPSHQEPKIETPSCQSNECSPVTQIEPSFPSLMSSTCNSWCYLNYIKPNPITLDEQKPSVYSSWSTSGYDPNPPGLSSKTVLSLLHCKQRLSPTIYTTSTMSATTHESREPEKTKRPSSPEVYNVQSCRDHNGGQQPVDKDSSNKSEEEKADKKIWTSNERSNEKCSSHGVKCQCEGCGVDHKDTSVLQKHTHVSTEAPPYSGRCNVAFKSDESFTKHARLKAVEEICCDLDVKHKVYGTCSVDPNKMKDVHYLDEDKCGKPESDIKKDSGSRHDEEKGSSADSENIPPFTPAPRDSAQRTSASVRRALFARRRFQPTACTPPGGSPEPPQKEPSPPRRSQSPNLPQSSVRPSTCSSPSCHVSSPPERLGSPVRCLPPRIVHSPIASSSGSPGSQTNTSAPDFQSKSTREIAVPHLGPHPARPREAHNLLSHLPLHSQQTSRTPNLLIPIGGIHMIQPRPSLRLYSSTATRPVGTEPFCRLADSPQEIRTSPALPASPPDPLTSRESSDGRSSKCQRSPTLLQPSSPKNEVSLSPQKVD